MTNPGGGATSLSALTDVNVVNDQGTDQNGLVFNYATGKWIASQALIAVPAVTTFNPSDKSNNIALSNSNLTATASSVGGGVRGTTARRSGKYYLEYTATTAGSNFGVGLYTPTANLAGGVTATGALLYVPGGIVWMNGGNRATYATYSAGAIIGLAVDLNNNAVWYRVNGGNWNNNVANNPATNTGGLALIPTLLGASLYPGFDTTSAGDVCTINAGGAAFANPAPSGFLSWDIFAPQGNTVGASPATFTAPTSGMYVVSGGTVSAITLTRGVAAAVNLGSLGGTYNVSPGDILTVTYTAAPTVTFVPLTD
jgi:hypothetical protein